jgi:AraC-like DNA-binding protein
MYARAVQQRRVAASAATRSALGALLVFDCERDVPLIAIPRPEIQLVARFGPAARAGLDVHAFGPRHTVHRKLIRSGQRSVTARLRLGAANAVLGVPASALGGRIVGLEELWGDAAARRLCEQLVHARDTVAAAAVLDRAIDERLATSGEPSIRSQIALAAADSLPRASVNAVAIELGVSERHLRRVFQEIIGMTPKAFAMLARFHRALRAARADRQASWASIAVAAGYYDQAHLIAEFRATAGVTPRALLRELSGVPSEETA